jgi:hypothetical protein
MRIFGRTREDGPAKQPDDNTKLIGTLVAAKVGYTLSSNEEEGGRRLRNYGLAIGAVLVAANVVDREVVEFVSTQTELSLDLLLGYVTLYFGGYGELTRRDSLKAARNDVVNAIDISHEFGVEPPEWAIAATNTQGISAAIEQSA